MVATSTISRTLLKGHIWLMMVHIGMGKTGVDGVRSGSRLLMTAQYQGPSSNLVYSGPSDVYLSTRQVQWVRPASFVP